MATLSKRRKMIQAQVTLGKVYPFTEAVEVLKACPSPKFVESVDVCINLGIDARQSTQMVRGATVLPHGVGKTVRVAVFTQGANAEHAKAAGADMVGMDDLAQTIQAGNFNFDVVIASPDAMGIVGRLGPVLGPRGLMPNPKVGTVTADIATAVKNAKGGQVRYRTDKNGIIHCSIGKLSFDAQVLQENLQALMSDLRKARPATAKGVYFKQLTVTTTMGPGLAVELSGLNF
jgi:large subunit ribosomal protein L1